LKAQSTQLNLKKNLHLEERNHSFNGFQTEVLADEHKFLGLLDLDSGIFFRSLSKIQMHISGVKLQNG
jgi:hypothetical protein